MAEKAAQDVGTTKDKSVEKDFSWLTLTHLLVLVCALLSAKFGMNIRELETDLLLERTRLNVTRNAKYDLVIFNRVPKVGSQVSSANTSVQ